MIDDEDASELLAEAGRLTQAAAEFLVNYGIRGGGPTGPAYTLGTVYTLRTYFSAINGLTLSLDFRWPGPRGVLVLFEIETGEVRQHVYWSDENGANHAPLEDADIWRLLGCP